ncbi:MAG: CRISPR system precrRNA processing endoribonuclease RAMP protein Cas6 [Bryobacterales bacterium]|nr:CRISPR system precrRNA processing endoribonuclease RAMP protein Cas6 [Bryobacterales bacterium]
MNPTFDLYPLRFRVTPRGAASFTPNLLRGAFGSALKQLSEDDYQRFFAPSVPPGGGPSGLADPPRPFVFRLREAHGIGARNIGMNVFAPTTALFIRAMGHIAAFAIEAVEGIELLRLPLTANSNPVNRLRVHFLTPTELKGADQPEFGTLLARIRDRISTLRQLYGPGALNLDFTAFGERAARVTMTRCVLTHVATGRTSRATGQRHSLGGFTGIAEYEGDLAEFVPYLEIARWTGVGRQTVWGKGEIAYETL